MKKEKAKYCRCGEKVIKETDKELKKNYPYYCPACNENMYNFELHEKREE